MLFSQHTPTECMISRSMHAGNIFQWHFVYDCIHYYCLLLLLKVCYFCSFLLLFLRPLRQIRTFVLQGFTGIIVLFILFSVFVLPHSYFPVVSMLLLSNCFLCSAGLLSCFFFFLFLFEYQQLLFPCLFLFEYQPLLPHRQFLSCTILLIPCQDLTWIRCHCVLIQSRPAHVLSLITAQTPSLFLFSSSFIMSSSLLLLLLLYNSSCCCTGSIVVLVVSPFHFATFSLAHPVISFLVGCKFMYVLFHIFCSSTVSLW